MVTDGVNNGLPKLGMQTTYGSSEMKVGDKVYHVKSVAGGFIC